MNFFSSATPENTDMDPNDNYPADEGIIQMEYLLVIQHKCNSSNNKTPLGQY